jgi:hypothetical protein
MRLREIEISSKAVEVTVNNNEKNSKTFGLISFMNSASVFARLCRWQITLCVLIIVQFTPQWTHSIVQYILVQNISFLGSRMWREGMGEIEGQGRQRQNPKSLTGGKVISGIGLRSTLA